MQLLPQPFPDPSEPGCIDQIEIAIAETLQNVPTPGAAYLDLVLQLADSALADVDLPQTRVALIALARGYGGASRTRWNLAEVSKQKLPAIVACIEKMAAGSDSVISGARTHQSTGTFGDIVEALANIVWRATFYPDKSGRIAVAELLPKLIAAYPGISSNLVFSMLGDHPNRAEAAAQIMTIQMEAGQVARKGLTSLAHDLLSRYASRDDPMFKVAPKVMKLLPDPLPISDEDTKRIFVEGRLDIVPTTAVAEIALRRGYIERAMPEADGTATEEPNSVMPSTLAAIVARDSIARNEVEISRLETDFDGWVRKKRDAAVRRLVVAKPTRRAYETLAPKVGPLTRRLIETLLAEGDAIAERPRIYAVAKPPDKTFADFGLKLLVIEELMFKQAVLTPKLTLDQFAQEYLERQIDSDADGYSVIPEIAKYLKALPIPAELLARITRLHQSSGLDGGAGIYDALWPFFDAGSGDAPIAVTNRAVQDLALLPKLKIISGLENSEPGSKLRKALTGAGVTLIDEAEASFH